ncbi:Rox3 mediator complex subunit-domain-containing protein [Usnea florida]
MDVHHDGQRIADRIQDKDIMDTSIDNAYEPSSHSVDSEAPTKPQVAVEAAPAPVSDNPIEQDEGAQQLSKQMPLIPQTLPLTQNLISLFGLQPLAATVARTDPVTGEKINKMRKSYEGQLKTLGLAGRNRSVKHVEGKFMGLRDLTLWPEEEWQNQKVGSKDVHKGLPSGIEAKLEKAMQMQPGLLPNHSEWENLLGNDNPKAVEAAKASKLPSKPLPKANAQANGNTVNMETVRPQRTNKKRSYGDASFEGYTGYAEGIEDDDADTGGGYSSGDTQFSRKSGRATKKRKKGYGNSPTDFGERRESFNASMAGLGAYSR